MLYRDCRPGGQLFIGDTTLTALEKQGSTLCFRLDTAERLHIVSGHAYIQGAGDTGAAYMVKLPADNSVVIRAGGESVAIKSLRKSGAYLRFGVRAPRSIRIQEK